MEFTKKNIYSSELEGKCDSVYIVYDNNITIKLGIDEDPINERFTIFSGGYEFHSCNIILENSICCNGSIRFKGCKIDLKNDSIFRAENGIILFENCEIIDKRDDKKYNNIFDETTGKIINL